jgi:hypothetical protein
VSNKPLSPDLVETIESALEERKTPSDRRRETDVRSPFVDSQMDRRSGVDRRDEDEEEK